MKIEFKADIAGFERAVKQLAQLQQKDGAEALQTAAKGFVKTAQSWTPPGSPKSQGSAARKLGEEAVKRDLAKLFVATRKQVAAVAMQATHKAARNRLGRVRKARAKTPVPVAELRRYEKLVLGRVGWLASGWNAAAMKLGVRVPVEYQDFANADEELAVLLSDNALAELAETSEDDLKALLKDLDGKLDLELTGLPNESIEDLLRTFEGDRCTDFPDSAEGSGFTLS